jgi:hypothetical protein
LRSQAQSIHQRLTSPALFVRSGRLEEDRNMKLIAMIMTTAGAIAVGLPAVAAQPSSPGNAPAQNVTVVNGAGTPVPVTGNVGVTGSVSVSNTPTVNVDGLSGVAVEPGRSPYQQVTSFNPGPSFCPNAFYCVVQFPAVPAGKRLVVTYVSAEFSLNEPALNPSAGIGVNGNVFSAMGLPAREMKEGTTRFLSSGSLMYFVEAGQQPSVFCQGTNVTPSSQSAYVAIVGYLVSVP